MDRRIPDFVEKQKLVELDERPKAVFVGDTHGDLEASERVWDRFGEEVTDGEIYLVFLGDYVDRGSRSKENIDFLLSKKEENPGGVILLMGNHDAYNRRELSPSNFWRSLGREDYQYYKDLDSLPWMATCEGLVASHGCLPFISNIDELKSDSDDMFDKKNDYDIPIWVSLAWGDINERVSEFQTDPLTGRPQFGRDAVFEYMNKHDWNVLIRAHQPETQGWNFSKKVLTIFTSDTYVKMGRAQERSVAIVNVEDRVEDSGDVRVVGLEEF